MAKLDHFLEMLVWGNTLAAWGVALMVAAGIAAGIYFARAVVLARLHLLADRGLLPFCVVVILDVLRNETRALVIFVVAVFIAGQTLALPENIAAILQHAAMFALILQGALWLTAAFSLWISEHRRRILLQNPGAAGSVGVMKFIVYLLIWATALLLFLDSLGVNITALAAGLGIGGVAVALALQSILGDLFSSLTIVLDKPFVVGDFVNLGEHMGTIESVGLKTTRIRSLSGEQIILSNSDLLSSRIRNFGRMQERRIIFSLGVTYDTPREKLKMIPQIIRESIAAAGNTRFDRSHFKTYGAFSLEFESVYYVGTAEFNAYMDIQQNINFLIHERFEQEGIRFAFPTQTVFVHQAA